MKKTLLTAAIAASAIFVLLTQQTASAQDGKTPDRNSCSDYLKSEKDLTAMVKKIEEDYAKDGVFLAKFRHSQAMWKAYKESQIEMIYPSASKEEYGQAYPTCRCGWLIGFANARMDFLVNWLQHAKENETCGGSINSTKRKSYVKMY